MRFIAFFLLLFLFQPSISLAQFSNIPLFYQLIEAYKPNSNNNIGTPIYNQGSVLGTNTSNQINTIKNSDTITIAILGDSMIDTLGPGIPQLQNSINHYYPNKKIKILNYGYGSSTMEYALARLTADYEYLGHKIPSLISQKPDIIILESFAYNNFGNTQSGFDKQTQLIDQISNLIHEQLPKTTFLLATTISPNSIIFANGVDGAHFNSLEKVEKTNTIKKYLQNTINYAKIKHIPYIDAYTGSLNGNEGIKEFINPKDNIHPSVFGGEFFCDTVAKALFDNHIIP